MALGHSWSGRSQCQRSPGGGHVFGEVLADRLGADDDTVLLDQAVIRLVRKDQLPIGANAGVDEKEEQHWLTYPTAKRIFTRQLPRLVENAQTR